jgi:hypothetical protein
MFPWWFWKQKKHQYICQSTMPAVLK